MPRILIHTDAIVDYRGVIASPGAILMEDDRIVATGTPQSIGTLEGVILTQIDKVVTPSFVNTHTHLDLSGVGPQPARGSFCSWIEDVVFPIRSDSSSSHEAVSKGLCLVQKGGSAMIGDVSGSLESANIVLQADVVARTFVELLGTGDRQYAAIDAMASLPQGMGVEPHAPYSCGLDLYRAAFKSGRPLTTHLAETNEELEYARNKTGEISAFIKRVGVWDDQELAWASHPIDTILDIAGDVPFIAAHLNYVDDHHLQRLSESNVTVAYCPRASAYFGHQNHRWQEMIDVGINVALGTDSLLCLDTSDRISILDEMRFLYAVDSSIAQQLMGLATISGANGLGFESGLVTLEAGKTLGLLAFDAVHEDPIRTIFDSTHMPTWL